MHKPTTEQVAAATAVGSVAVTAGAGTGKTSTLADRYLHHVVTDSLSPLSIVAVTFTEKAALELRSRIRSRLQKASIAEEIVTEVDAAQITTMHALASRICRDFYDLAGIPPDFRVLDETDAPAWQAEKFEEALSHLEPALIEELGFDWLAKALAELLWDPYSSEKALALGSANWQTAIESESRAALEEFVNCVAWKEAHERLPTLAGKAGDALEVARASAINALEQIHQGGDVAAAFGSLMRMQAHLGQKGNWPPGGKEVIGGCLKRLKVSARSLGEVASLSFGANDLEAASRLDPLKAAFRQVRGFLAAEKLKENFLDFNDLEHYALEVLRHPQAVEHYRKRWKAFLVDEFQDTNPVQADILERLTASSTLTIVGDEKQSIYAFRGADVRVFEKVRLKITDGGGERITLAQTFRSHQYFTERANAIFSTVLGGLHQPLRSERVPDELKGPFITAATVQSGEDASKNERLAIEGDYIAEQIRELHQAHGIPYGEIAILTRKWAPLDAYLAVLAAHGIPALHAGGGSLFETRVAKDIYALLSFISDPQDDIPLVAVLRSPFFAVSDLTLFKAVPPKGISWWAWIGRQPEFRPVTAVLEQILDAASNLSAEQAVKLASRLTGYEAVMLNLPGGERRAADIRGVLDLLRKLEMAGRGDVFSSVRHFRQLIEYDVQVPRPPLESGDAVTLMTIHRAKGLEWRAVFVPDLNSKVTNDAAQVLVDDEIGVAFKLETDTFDKTEPSIFKLIRDRKQKSSIAEARRLLYVAVTRAKDFAFLTANDKAESESLLEILLPGLDAADIPVTPIPFDPTKAEGVFAGEAEPFTLPEVMNHRPLNIGPSDISATALSTYAKCPLRFKYQFVEGHPGIFEGSSDAMLVGSLAHLALEFDIDDLDTLRSEADNEADSGLLERALEFARNFRTGPAFAEIRNGVLQKEFGLNGVIGDIRVLGNADVVGDDFVLDYKTDYLMSPDEHRFQLWAYSRLAGKSRAYLAYLAHGQLYEFTPDALASIDEEAVEMLGNISKGRFDATPSEAVCKHCGYAAVCGSRFKAESVEVSGG